MWHRWEVKTGVGGILFPRKGSKEPLRGCFPSRSPRFLYYYTMNRHEEKRTLGEPCVENILFEPVLRPYRDSPYNTPRIMDSEMGNISRIPRRDRGTNPPSFRVSESHPRSFVKGCFPVTPCSSGNRACAFYLVCD